MWEWGVEVRGFGIEYVPLERGWQVGYVVFPTSPLCTFVSFTSLCPLRIDRVPTGDSITPCASSSSPSFVRISEVRSS